MQLVFPLRLESHTILYLAQRNSEIEKVLLHTDIHWIPERESELQRNVLPAQVPVNITVVVVGGKRGWMMVVRWYPGNDLASWPLTPLYYILV